MRVSVNAAQGVVVQKLKAQLLLSLRLGLSVFGVAFIVLIFFYGLQTSCNLNFVLNIISWLDRIVVSQGYGIEFMM